MRFSLLRDLIKDKQSQQYELFKLELEMKPSNFHVGPLFLTKLDIKLTLRDLIMMTQLDRMKRGEKPVKYRADVFALERISKLVVSSAESIEKYITKEILLKFMKSIIANNSLIIKRRCGKVLAMTVTHEDIKKRICLREKVEGKPSNAY